MLYLLVIVSVAAMSGAQLLLKKGLEVIQFPQGLGELVPFFVKAFSNVYIISALVLTVVTALAWILAVARSTEISQIYPFMALSYVLVALFSWFIFHEGVTAMRWVGIALICLGVFFVARS
jgi:drug/metabolite transporter (DMT)-like permease